MSRSRKGGHYEREIAKKLSLWWSKGKRSDIFWRVGGSGGRAKRRGRTGQTTAFQHGDICATDPIGNPLIDLITIEIKRGYVSSTFHDVFDSPVTFGQQPFEGFLQQAIESYEQAGSYAWWLIHKRDQREPLIYMPTFFYNKLIEVCGIKRMYPIGYFTFAAKMKDKKVVHYRKVSLCVVPLAVVLSKITREHIKSLAKVV